MRLLNVFVFILCFSSSIFAQENEIQFQKSDFKSFQLQNNKDKTFYFVDFYTDWCGYCKKLDQTTFKDPKVVELMNTYFNAYKLNAESTEGRPVAKALGVRGYPTMVIFNAEGEPVETIGGFVDGAKMAQILEAMVNSEKLKPIDRTKKEEEKALENTIQNNILASYTHRLEEFLTENKCHEEVYAYGEKNDYPAFQELLLLEDCPNAEAVYNLAKGNLEFTKDETLNQLVLEKKLSEGEISISLLKKVNEIFYSSGETDMMYYKIYLEYLLGNQKDAKNDLSAYSRRLSNHFLSENDLENLLK